MISFESLKSEYEGNWANLEIRPSRLSDANAVARKAINGKATYQQIERLTGVPWYFAALCHYRESNFDFDTYLGNGETLHRVTALVPKGRGPFATFVDGAVDAFPVMGFAVVIASALTGLAVLRMYFSLFCGRSDPLPHSGLRFGLMRREAWTFVALVIALVGFGVLPRPLVDSRFAASDDILRLRQMHMARAHMSNRY